jgi:hypothetical protein
MTQDIAIRKIADGTDFLLLNNDLAVTTGYENLPLLLMFSGSGKWWANQLFFSSNPYQSNTEAALQSNTIGSAGLNAITAAITQDLQPLNDIPGTTFSVNCTIANPQRLNIDITVNGNTFAYYWNPATGINVTI